MAVIQVRYGPMEQRFDDETPYQGETATVVYDGTGEMPADEEFGAWPRPKPDPELQAWIDGGGVPLPYDPYYGQSEDEIKAEKYEANRLYAENLVSQAEHNPVQGVNLDDRNHAKSVTKRNNKAKNNKISAQDDALIDYIDAVYDAQDLADDTVENLTGDALRNWNPGNNNWPIWQAPAGN